MLAEFEAGNKLRQIAYNRDGDGWEPPEGSQRPWEVDFHFALPVDGFEKRDLSLLPRLPDASYGQLAAFVEKLGYDFQLGPHARFEKRGFFSRLFGG